MTLLFPFLRGAGPRGWAGRLASTSVWRRGPTTLDEVFTDVMAGEARTERNEDYRIGRSDS